MVTVLLRRLLVLSMVVIGVVGTGVLLPAQAAKPVRAAVEITAVQTAEESGNGFELTVLGTVRGSNYVYVTVGEDPNVYESYAYKGDWAAGLNPQPAGTLPICAEVRDAAGAVLARDCVDYTRPVDPVYFQVISPAQDEEVSSTFTSVVACHGGSTVRMTLDGVSEVLPCDDYSVSRRYVDLVGGQPHADRRDAGPRRHHRRRVGDPHLHLRADPGRHRRHHLPRRRCHRLVDGAHRHRDRFLQRLPGSPGVRRRRVRRPRHRRRRHVDEHRSPCRSAPAGSAPR